MVSGRSFGANATWQGSGRGAELAGEGAIRLPYALFAAGNRSAVMTLWKVVGASSARLAPRLFDRIAAGASPEAALARPKREFMCEPRLAHPLHWAGFVLYGS